MRLRVDGGRVRCLPRRARAPARAYGGASVERWLDALFGDPEALMTGGDTALLGGVLAALQELLALGSRPPLALAPG